MHAAKTGSSGAENRPENTYRPLGENKDSRIKSKRERKKKNNKDMEYGGDVMATLVKFSEEKSAHSPATTTRIICKGAR